ncbi:unnamed protein product (macronuclear) [Paramecium tetraurelia]|uniref:Uncharacterized protein n=1 Tax=Paramecium tetraurelia TaxID=5888 RepID=A0C521_PARTE|nr:uncharacterized protein GSPATT00006387001 [Paramecium tetraurelia]CAK65888.1 unnamed protein product [Paramecium tetraurelia]|eukprot:XP_001433285.1 hypothetical protein (macronuclear) [Paramecium tetraurelia strain d4-2]
MQHFSPWSQKIDTQTHRMKNKAQLSLSPYIQPKTGRLNNLSLQQHPRRVNSQFYKQQNSGIQEESKQYNNASSQTDLPSLELEDLIYAQQQQEQSSRRYQNAILQTKNHYHQTTIISLLQTIHFKPDQLQSLKSKAQQLKRVIVQSKNRTISVVVVNNATQFVSHLFNSNYFEQAPDNFFNTQHHPSFFMTQVTISNSNASNTVHSYQDLLTVTKKNRIYDVSLNRLLYDQSQSFIHYCPDIVIVTIGNLQEELSNRQRDKSFLVRSAEQIQKETNRTIRVNKKRTKLKLKELN